MSNLLQLVLHHLEGEESITRTAYNANGTKIITQKTFGASRWIERVRERRIMTALDCIALIFFVLDEFNGKEQASRIVDGWEAELRRAALSGEISARDPFTMLALGMPPDGFEWGVSTADVDKFLGERGIEWKCADVVEHIYQECKSSIDDQRFPIELDLRKEDAQKDSSPNNPASTLNAADLTSLFDGVGYATLEKMFPTGCGTKWKNFAERAKRNGLSASKVGRGLFNPMLAAEWWLKHQKPDGWDLARCLRVLSNNLPVRSIDQKHLVHDDTRY